MEADRRERVILLGVVPLLAAALGAVATVLAQRYFGSAEAPSDAVIAVLQMPSLSTEDRLKLIEAVTRDSQSFYSLLHILLGLLAAPLGFLIYRFAPR